MSVVRLTDKFRLYNKRLSSTSVSVLCYVGATNSDRCLSIMTYSASFVISDETTKNVSA